MTTEDRARIHVIVKGGVGKRQWAVDGVIVETEPYCLRIAYTPPGSEPLSGAFHFHGRRLGDHTEGHHRFEPRKPLG